MEKRKTLLIIICTMLMLAGCYNSVEKGDISKASYLLVSTDQFGDSSEIVGLTDSGKVCYKKELNFGGVKSIFEDEQFINIYTYNDSYKLDKKDSNVTKMKIDSAIDGVVYNGSIKTYGNDYYYEYNQGFGETYYLNAILKNDETLIDVDGTVMCYEIKNDIIYYIYSHTKSMSEGYSDFKLGKYDLNLKRSLKTIDLSFFNQYSFISGTIMNNSYYLYAYASHDQKDSSIMFVKMNLENGEYEKINLEENSERELRKRNHSLINKDNCFIFKEKLFFMQEMNQYLEWDTNTDFISAKNLDQYDDDTLSYYKIENETLIRLGYKGEKLCLYYYDLNDAHMKDTKVIDYQPPEQQVLYDFILLK